MKKRPILFSAPMVRAILDGTKTQTRRMVKPAPMMVTDKTIAPWDGPPGALKIGLEQLGRGCPYGKPGDGLWVREAFAIVPRTAYRCSEGVQQTLRPDDDHDAAIYREGWTRSRSGFRWRPSIHMPRWASRITLEVTGVRVERLQDISEADARAEGARECDPISGREVLLAGPSQRGSYVLHYRDIWEQINGPGSWDANPWVWVVEFKRLEGGAA